MADVTPADTQYSLQGCNTSAKGHCEFAGMEKAKHTVGVEPAWSSDSGFGAHTGQPQAFSQDPPVMNKFLVDSLS